MACLGPPWSTQVDKASEVPPSPESPFFPALLSQGLRSAGQLLPGLGGGRGDVLGQIPGSGESPRGSVLMNPNPGSFVFSSWEFRVCRRQRGENGRQAWTVFPAILGNCV